MPEDDNGMRRRSSDPPHPSALTSEALFMPMLEQAQAQTEKALVLRASRTVEEMAAIVKLFNTLLEERDRLYMSKFAEQEKAVDKALAAAEKGVTTAFASSEKAIAAAAASNKEAITKSEVAQHELNNATYVSIKGLEMQLAQLMPKGEATVRMSNLEKEINNLREERSKTYGQREGGLDMRAAMIAIAGLILTLLTIASIVLSR